MVATQNLETPNLYSCLKPGLSNLIFTDSERAMNKLKNKVNKLSFKNLIFIFFILISLVSCSSKDKKLYSQPKDELPFSSKIVTGRLENKITYYVVKNKFPQKKIEFRLNVRTGSLNETDEERGIAHFVEHMAFNGTKHFKHNELIEFLEEAGLTFGKHSNAYTSTNVTNYQLTIPSDKKDLVNKAYLIMSDWADGLMFNKDEIEKEKGVITEEWRMRKSASSRIRNEFGKVLYQGSRYPERDPIGEMEIVKNADRNLLKNYYDKWYTPENMSIIIVGDIDINETIIKIKETFSCIKKRNSPPKKDDSIPSIEGLRVISLFDPEFTTISCTYDLLWQDEKIDSLKKLEKRILKETAMELFSKRINQKIITKEIPLLKSFSIVRDLVPGTDIGRFIFLPADKKIKQGFEAIFTEIERAKKFGFTNSEFEEYTKAVLKNLEDNARPEKRFESFELADEIISYDLEKDYLLDPETELKIYKKILSSSKIEDINLQFKKILSSKSAIISITTPESEKHLAPNESEIKDIMKKSALKELEPYFLENLKIKFPDNPKKSGTIISSQKISSADASLYTLSNNAKILIKKTSFNPGEFYITAIKKGGYSVLEGNDFRIGLYAAQIINQSGFKNIKPADIPRLLAGITANISPESSEYTVSYSGQGLAAEAETIFKMLYLYFTQPNVDEKILENYITTLEQTYENNKENKMYNFLHEAGKKINNENYRSLKLEKEDIKLLKSEQILKVYEKLFSGIESYIFTITGDVNEKEIAGLAAKYLGGIEKQGTYSNYKDRNIHFKKNHTGNNIIISGKGEIENKATVKMHYESNADFCIEDSLKISILSNILSSRMRTNIREEKGGVYSINPYLRLSFVPSPKYSAFISFTCDPDRVSEITSAAESIFMEIHDKGVTKEEFETAKKQMLTELEASFKTNEYWLSGLSTYSVFGWPMEKFVNKKAVIDSLATSDINAIAKKYLYPKKGYTLVFEPEKI